MIIEEDDKRDRHEEWLQLRRGELVGLRPHRIVIDDPAMPPMTEEQRAEGMRRMRAWFNAGHLVAPEPSPTPLHPCDMLTRLLEAL